MRAARRRAKLRQIDFESGLGRSAWLLYGLVRSLRPRVCVEIGSARGCSTAHIALGLRDNGMGELFAIDPHQPTEWNDLKSVDTQELLAANLRLVGVRDRVNVIRKSSSDAARDWSRPIDLLFIDGDHSLSGCRGDWDLFSPFVTQFGVVVFHDTTWEYHKDSKWYRSDCGVPAVVDDLRREGYPVISWDQDCGLSLVQPSRGGVPLVGQDLQLSVAVPSDGPRPT